MICMLDRTVLELNGVGRDGVTGDFPRALNRTYPHGLVMLDALARLWSLRIATVNGLGEVVLNNKEGCQLEL